MAVTAAYGLSDFPYQLADFNNEYVKITNADEWLTDSIGTMKYTFNLYLDNSYGYYNQLLQISSSTNQSLYAWLFDSSICFSYGSISSYRTYSIKTFSRQILECDVRLNPYVVGSQPYYFTINGAQQASTNISATLGAGAAEIGATYIGRSTPTVFNGSGTSQLDNATVWNVKVTEVSTGTVKHEWKGWPAGNTITGWQDLVGSNDAISESVRNYRNDIYGTSTTGVAFVYNGALLSPYTNVTNYLIIDQVYLSFDENALACNTSVINVQSNVAWTVTYSQAWVYGTNSGSGNGTITLTVTSNAGNLGRQATVTVSGAGVTSQICIIDQMDTGETCG